MNYDGFLLTLPREMRWFIAIFVLVLSIGFFSGLLFVNQTSSTTPQGMEENYLGNEADEAASVMKFKKSEREILTIVHTHVLSMSMIFFLMGILVWLLKLPKGLKVFLSIEPFFSVIMTFGGIYLLWLGYQWVKYLVLFSGILMTLSFVLSALLILLQVLKFHSGFLNKTRV